MSKILSGGVGIIDSVLKSLGIQDTVVIYPWISAGDYGEPVYGIGVTMYAVVEEKERKRRLDNGQEITQKASLTIPRTIAANGANERREPIDPRDKIVLPSGYTGPILDVSGVVDPDTRVPYSFDVILG